MKFGRKKKNETAVSTAAPIVQEAESKAQQIQETKETNVQLSQARVTKDEVDSILRYLRNDPEFQHKILKAAQKKEEKVEKLQQAKEAEEALAKKEGREPVENKLYKLEEGMYILPGEQLDEFLLAIDAIELMFQSKSAAESVEKGVDILNALLKEYLLQLQEALEDARAKTADACLTVLKYVIEVGYRFEGTADPRRLQERMDAKIDFVQKTGTQLIRTISEYYNLLADYEITSADYAEVYKTYIEKVREINDMPEEISQKIDRLGFKRAMRELPPGDTARQYLKIILDTNGELAMVYMRSMELESMALGLSDLEHGYREYLTECKRAFERKGDTFDYEAHQKRLYELRKRSVDNINRINDMAVESHKLNEKTQALLKEAAENPELGLAVSSARQAIRYYEKLDSHNRHLQKVIQDNKAASQQKIDVENTQEEVQDNEPQMLDADMQ